MNTQFTIKNFRVFDEKGVTIDMKPVTILTGCNSSGKSSIVKSMVLLDTYIDSLQKDYDAFKRIALTKHKLDFKKETTISLGSFNRVIHRGAENNTLTFEYMVHSLMLGEDVNVSMEFEPDDKDVFNEGYLKSVTISNANGDVIYSSSKEMPCSANYNLILNNFFRFVIGQYLVDRYQQNEAKEEDDFVMNDDEWEEMKTFFTNYYGEITLKDVITWVNRNGNDYYEIKLFGITGNKGKDNKKTFVDKYLDGKVDVVKDSCCSNSLFSVPLMKTIEGWEKDGIVDKFEYLLKDIPITDAMWMAIRMICKDFIDSDTETFGAYFHKKEEEQMMFHMESNFCPKGHAPFVSATSFWNIGECEKKVGINDTFRTISPDPGVIDQATGEIIPGTEESLDKMLQRLPSVDFSMVYDVIMEISTQVCREDTTLYVQGRSGNGIAPAFNHRMFGMFKEYVQKVMADIMIMAMPHGISYIPSSLVSVKSLYSLDGTDELTKMLKRYVELSRTYDGQDEFTPYSFIDKWIRNFDIGYSVRIESDSEDMLGATIRLYKNKEDKKGILLADVGYGITQLFVLLLRVEIAIMEAQIECANNNPLDMGKPSIWRVKSNRFSSKFTESNIAIEEPEVHLHPKFQSLLADLFVDAYTNYNVHFIVETHSEYLIRKLQVMVADKESSLSSNDVVLYYVDKEESEMSTNRKIDILEDGRLSEPFGSGFYDEATGLSMYLLKMKMEQI